MISCCLHRQLRSALAGRDVPEDIKAQIMKFHEDNMNAREQLKVMTDKFNKAKAVRIGSHTSSSWSVLTYPFVAQIVHQGPRQAIQGGTCEEARFCKCMYTDYRCLELLW